jgi:2,4-dienoyl-CoA reductase-like NADH-dependent reductase (Old Yellow Enzyme family)
VSASAIAIKGNNSFGDPHEVPRALEIDEIPGLINDYVKAAENAIEAGFDGVEIHGANGYIIDQFIETSSNKRTDRYGGSIENRTRLALEVVDAVVKAIGADKTAIRLSPFTTFQDMADETPLDTWGYLVQQLQANHPDLAYLHMIEPRFTFEDSAGSSEHNLDHFRKIWKSVFINAGGFGHDLSGAIEHAEKTGDMIAFGRYYIANPDLPYRIEQKLPLNPYNRETFYGNGPEGYTDYPTYEESNSAPLTAATA